MNKILYSCKCSHDGEHDVLFNLHRVCDEVREYAQHPCADEASDVMMNISTLLHAVCPAWIWLLPGANRSQDKGQRRYADHGCCRSVRNSCNKS